MQPLASAARLCYDCSRNRRLARRRREQLGHSPARPLVAARMASWSTRPILGPVYWHLARGYQPRATVAPIGRSANGPTAFKGILP